MSGGLGDLAPMPTTNQQRGTLAHNAAEAALTLVSRVRDDDPRVVWQNLQTLSPQQLLAMTIALAAMVDEDKTVGELLAWTEGLVA